MPHKSPSPCRYPACPALTTKGYCPTHQAQEYQRDRQYRGSATHRGYTHPWRAYSETYRKDHPWCVQCLTQGYTVPSAIVDHIQPVTGPTDPLFWDASNHQALCFPCHNAKTRREGRTAIPQPQLHRVYNVDKTRKWYVL